MHRESIDPGTMALLHALEKSICPSQIEIFGVPARTHSHEKRLRIIGRKLCDEAAVECRILQWRHVSAAAPGLVADSPPAHAKGLSIAVGSALAGQRNSAHRRIAVEHPIVELTRRTGGHICREIWLC